MRQFGLDLRRRLRGNQRPGRRFRGGRGRGLRARGYVTIVTQREVITEIGVTDRIALRSGGPLPKSVFPEALFAGPGCPGVLSRLQWLGIGGFDQSQLQAAGAVFPEVGQKTFWLGPGPTFYQFWRLSSSDVRGRSCGSTLSAADARRAIEALQSASPATLLSLGYR